MFRTIFTIGLFAVGGLFLLKLTFGLFGGAFALLFWLFSFALKAAIVGALVYLVIRLFSPSTARRLRSKWSGPGY